MALKVKKHSEFLTSIFATCLVKDGENKRKTMKWKGMAVTSLSEIASNRFYTINFSDFPVFN